MKKLTKLQQAKALFQTLTGLPAKKANAKMLCAEGSLDGLKMLSTADWHHAIANISKRVALVQFCPFDTDAQEQLDAHHQRLREAEEERKAKEERKRKREERRKKWEEEAARYEEMMDERRKEQNRRAEEDIKKGNGYRWQWNEEFQVYKEVLGRRRWEEDLRREQERQRQRQEQSYPFDLSMMDDYMFYRGNANTSVKSSTAEIDGSAKYIAHCLLMGNLEEAETKAKVHVLRGDYKSLAKYFHPDLNKLDLSSDKCTQAMQVLNNANDRMEKVRNMFD